jgi:hypothetical protein
MCNTCIFIGGIIEEDLRQCGSNTQTSTPSGTPGGSLEDFKIQNKMSVSNNDIKIVSLMALELKNTFDK